MKLFSNDPKKTRTQYGKFITQKSWFRTEEDLNFEDSFKFWFALMWQNKYIQLAVVGLVATTLELINLGSLLDTCRENAYQDGFWGGLFSYMGMLIMPAMLTLVSYKGLWQYWDDMKKGRSR